MNGLHHLLAKYELDQLNPLVDDYLSAQVAAWLIAEIEPELSKRQQAIDELKSQIDRVREAAEEIRRQADSLQTELKEADQQAEGDNELGLQYQALRHSADQKTVSWRNLERWLEDLIAKRARLEAFLDELKAIRSPEGEQVRKAVKSALPPVPVFRP